MVVVLCESQCQLRGEYKMKSVLLVLLCVYVLTGSIVLVAQKTVPQGPMTIYNWSQWTYHS